MYEFRMILVYMNGGANSISRDFYVFVNCWVHFRSRMNWNMDVCNWVRWNIRSNNIIFSSHCVVELNVLVGKSGCINFNCRMN